MAAHSRVYSNNPPSATTVFTNVCPDAKVDTIHLGMKSMHEQFPLHLTLIILVKNFELKEHVQLDTIVSESSMCSSLRSNFDTLDVFSRTHSAFRHVNEYLETVRTFSSQKASSVCASLQNFQKDNVRSSIIVVPNELGRREYSVRDRYHRVGQTRK